MFSRRFRKKTRDLILLVVLVIGVLLYHYFGIPLMDQAADYLTLTDQGQFVLNAVDEDSNETAPVKINDGMPLFDSFDFKASSYEDYALLDL